MTDKWVDFWFGVAVGVLSLIWLVCVAALIVSFAENQGELERAPRLNLARVALPDEPAAVDSACPERDPALVKCLLAGGCSMINGGRYLVHHHQLIVFDAETCWALGRVH